MTDIVHRLRHWRNFKLANRNAMFDEAAFEIELLRSGAVADCDTVCQHVRGTVTQHCSLNFTLTDEEREAIVWCVELLDELESSKADTLRDLLERLHI
jgi:hypothetical protein